MSIRLAKIPPWLEEIIRTGRAPDSCPHALKKAVSLEKLLSLEGVSRFVPLEQFGFQKGSRDDSLFHIAKCLYRGGMPPGEAEQVIRMLANNCIPPFPEKDALDKIQSAYKGARTLAQEIRAWVNGTKGGFTGTELDKDLGIGTKGDKDNRKKILQRLGQEGIIEKVGPGLYRVIDRECNELAFLNADAGAPQLIKWPFDLQNLVNVYKKNLIIVAGSKDAGKTAYLLNTIRLNMDHFKTVYFSSEMGEQELALRLSKFDCPMNSWKFKAYERASNFVDVVEPDALNFIDFLEITDNFYLIGGELRKIYDKLNNGLAVVAIQKDEKKDLARGGAFSLEKARLYITMDMRDHYNELKIVSGKNWAKEGINPKGKTFKYKLTNGCKFIHIV